MSDDQFPSAGEAASSADASAPQKPVFSTTSFSTKQILKAIFLPMSPKGRGCFGYLLYPLFLLAKICVILMFLDSFFLVFFMGPSFFIMTIIFFLWILPVVFGIRAFLGKTVQSNLSPSELKKQIVVLMQKKGGHTSDSVQDDVLQFEFDNGNNPVWIGVEVAQTDTTGGDGRAWAKVFLSNYTEGVNEVTFIPDDSSLLFWLKAFFTLFATNGSLKANKIIKQMAEEIPALVPRAPKK